MNNEERDYYNSKSKQESQIVAGYCFIALMILAVGVGVFQFVGWLAHGWLN